MAEGLLQRRTARSVVALAQGDEPTILRSTAVEVWDLLAEAPRSLAALASVLGARYGVSAEQVTPDLESFIDDLITAGLLVTGAAGEHGRAAGP